MASDVNQLKKEDDNKQVRAAILGATGYTGSELIKLLLGHPQVDLRYVFSRSQGGTAVREVFPAFRTCDLCFEPWGEQHWDHIDVLFFATPHGVAAQMAPTALEKGVRVIDLSADFRFQNADIYERWYGQAHPNPHLFDQAAYGLPELFRESIPEKRLIGNPGCYPTSIQIGLAPLLKAGLLEERHVIVDAKSGVSGAGRSAKVNLLASEIHGNFKAYGAGGHRHQPEIQAALTAYAAKHNKDAQNALIITFVPHLLPISRGIESSIYVRCSASVDELVERYQAFYASEPFVDVLTCGQLPEIKSVAGTNACAIGITRMADSPYLLISSVIDNLVKGAAGQAVQNMNLIFGFEEALGLNLLAAYP